MNTVPHPETLRLILGDYRCGEADRGRQVAWWQAAVLSRQEDAKRAGLAIVDGRIHPHQFRPGAAVMRQVAEQLVLNIDWLAESDTFRVLHARVGQILSVVAGAGEMAIYDTTDRLAHYLGLSPDAIHLHRGTREGARHLGLSGRWADVQRLPEALSKLSARDLEDILCNYKNDLLKDPARLRVELATHSRSCKRPPPRRRC